MRDGYDATLSGFMNLWGRFPRIARCAVNPGLMDGIPLGFVDGALTETISALGPNLAFDKLQHLHCLFKIFS